MRLRLRIERNEMPAVSVLWIVGDTEAKQTVAQFLERVDERFPLEGESWGLEDYAVTVGGYEALHYSEIGTCFQNEDEIVVKPLQYVDLRSRTISGRQQISEDGRHLLDGIPFGKPMLKRPRRPDVSIPPRKKRRTGDKELLLIENSQPGLLPTELLDNLTQRSQFQKEKDKEEDEEEEDEDEDEWVDEEEEEDDNDGSYEGGEDHDSESSEQSRSDEISSMKEARDIEDITAPRTRGQKRRASSEQNLILENGIPGAGIGDQANVSPSLTELSKGTSSDSDTSSDDDSSDSSTSSSSSDSDEDSSSEALWNGVEDRLSADREAPSTTPVSAALDRSLVAAGPEQSSSKRPLPFQGKADTKARNVRRREQRRLRFLKETGKLPSNATILAMYEYLERETISHKVDRQHSVGQNAVDELSSTRTLEYSAIPTATSAAADVLSVPAWASSDVAAGADASNGAIMSRDETASTADPTSEYATVESAPQPRKRIDLAGTTRLVFGSLGLQSPKTQAEREAIQEKLAARSQRRTAIMPNETHDPTKETTETSEEAEAWQDKIRLSAIECYDDDVTLSTPPFPFQQRWDPQYQNSRKHKRNNSIAVISGRQKKRGTNASAGNGTYVETYDKYFTDEGGDILEYDDPQDDDSYWEDGALLEDNFEEDDEPVDGFPPLPTDLSTLPGHVEADANKGDFVVFDELGVSAATNWQPGTIIRTVQLLEKDGDAWTVKFAVRDLPQKRYDDDGNRIYSKFEMEGLSDNEDEDTKSLQWHEMQNAKLLQRAA